jgi:hypothetical protein
MALSCLIYALYIWKYDTFLNIEMTFTFVCLLFEKKPVLFLAGSSFAKSKIEHCKNTRKKFLIEKFLLQTFEASADILWLIT